MSRYAGDADGDGRLDSGIGQLPAALSEHPVLADPPPGLCRSGAELHWTVDGDPAEAIPLAEDDDPDTCPAILAVEGEGEHKLTVAADGAPLADTVRVDDRLVVALGDSVASGEGNPVPGPAGRAWLERSCHRSSASGFEQAARLVGSRSGGVTLTFVNLACSGATIQRGLLGPYRGIEVKTGDAPLEPQVSRLRRLDELDRDGVDAVMISVGANDVGFADVVSRCIAKSHCDRSSDEPVRAALAELGGRYDALAEQLEGIVDEPSDDRPRDVILTEYFDPTRGPDGKFCSHSLPGITRAEVAWAADALLTPLGFEVSAASVRNKWRLAGGVAGDFNGHGYCAPKTERWVRTLTESVTRHAGSPLSGARVAGTLHPNEAGHLAIANRLAPELSAALGLTGTETKGGGGGPADEDGGFPLEAVLIVALVVILLALLWKTGILGRLGLLFVPSDKPGKKTAAARPTFKVPTLPESWIEFAVKGIVGVASIVVTAGFVAVVGAAILWVRFWAARIPPDEALAAVPNGQLIVVGAQALILFGVLGALATAMVWMLDGEGQATRPTRRGLGLLIVVELLLVVLLADLSTREVAWLIGFFVVGALLLHFLVDRAAEASSLLRAPNTLVATKKRCESAFRRPEDQESGVSRRVEKLRLREAWRALPFVVLAGAVYLARITDEQDRWLILLPLAAAAVLFVAPGGIAGAADKDDEPTLETLEPARIALAAGALACLTVLLFRDERWLAGTALVAVALAGGCLLVAKTSGKRFAPYGLAVLLSVPLFGAAASIVIAWDSPKAQPVAAISEDLSRTVCGLYVADTGDRLYLARAELDELGQVRRPTAYLSRLTSIDRDKLVAVAVGPLQPIARAQERALLLRRELLRQAQGGDHADLRGESCGSREPPDPIVASPERDLAEQFQPQVVVDRHDGFWPVPVRTIFEMEDRRAHACRMIDDRDDELCIRLTLQSDLPWSGGDGEFIEFPAANRKDDQRRLMLDALGSADPARTAREYFLVTGGESPDAPVSVQYWFFYTYNEQPLVAGSAGHHEGDFESVGVLLSAKTRRPRYMWMARHSDEGRMFVWDEVALQREGDHPMVFVAKGSHASYEHCARQRRPQAPKGLIDDRPTCDPKRQLRLAPEATRLADLSRVSWGCWRGLFGHVRDDHSIFERIPYIEADAPRSPLWQQDFGGVRAEPCRDVEEPDVREGLGEEVIPDEPAEQLRRGAGRLDALVDDCADWERPPAAGTYLVACDRTALRRFVASGLEDAGPIRVHVDAVGAEIAEAGDASVPAVRRDPLGRRLDNWRISATAPTTVDVYGSCRRGDALLQVRFAGVPLEARRPLRVDDRERDQWRLRRDDGMTIAMAEPEVARGRLERGEPLACGG